MPEIMIAINVKYKMFMEPQEIHQLLSPTTGEDEDLGPKSYCYMSNEFNSCLNIFNSHSKVYYTSSYLHINCCN